MRRLEEGRRARQIQLRLAQALFVVLPVLHAQDIVVGALEGLYEVRAVHAAARGRDDIPVHIAIAKSVRKHRRAVERLRDGHAAADLPEVVRHHLHVRQVALLEAVLCIALAVDLLTAGLEQQVLWHLRRPRDEEAIRVVLGVLEVQRPQILLTEAHALACCSLELEGRMRGVGHIVCALLQAVDEEHGAIGKPANGQWRQLELALPRPQSAAGGCVGQAAHRVDALHSMLVEDLLIARVRHLSAVFLVGVHLRLQLAVPRADKCLGRGCGLEEDDTRINTELVACPMEMTTARLSPGDFACLLVDVVGLALAAVHAHEFDELWRGCRRLLIGPG
mmetsp:Transcript_13195/g.55234  ORF Transcript_13195/g.55234 Transcript_13195/m.55234 type:complete len:335 (+) Transcript_13195:7885-8889(+)